MIYKTLIYFLFASIVFCCICPPNYITTVPAAKPSDFSLSSDDETINGVNYGPLIYINNMVFLTKDVKIMRGYNELGNDCPEGLLFLLLFII